MRSPHHLSRLAVSGGLGAALLACSASADDVAAGGADALSSSVAFHRFDGSLAEVTAWNDAVVVTNVSSVGTYASDPATTPGIGYASSTQGEAFLVATSGGRFSPLLAHPAGSPYKRVQSAASDGRTLFEITLESWTTYRLERIDAPGGAATNLGSFTAYGVMADGAHVFTIEPGAGKDVYKVVRRAYDGSGASELGSYQFQPTFLPLSETWAVGGGAAYSILRGSSRVTGFGAPAVDGPNDAQATLAAAGSDLYVAADSGLWHAAVGDASATLIRSADAMRADSGLANATCGRRYAYGPGAALAADAAAAYVVCADPSLKGAETLLAYDRAGHLLRHIDLPAEWSPLGRLVLTSTRFCAMQEWSYTSDPKFDELRCFPR
jgi:hypothetical protein